jgi:membrane protein DedA with SNARE-associated domain
LNLAAAKMLRATLHSGWSHVEPFIDAYGAIAIFFMIYFESVGAPLPGETGMIAASLLAAQQKLSIASVFAAALTGAVLGDLTGYLIGRFGGMTLLRTYGPYVKLTAQRLSTIEARFQKTGPWIVVIARFVPGLRQVNGLVAGSLAMPWNRFLGAQVVGALLWSSLYCFGPYLFSELFHLRHG